MLVRVAPGAPLIVEPRNFPAWGRDDGSLPWVPDGCGSQGWGPAGFGAVLPQSALFPQGSPPRLRLGRSSQCFVPAVLGFHSRPVSLS